MTHQLSANRENAPTRDVGLNPWDVTISPPAESLLATAHAQAKHFCPIPQTFWFLARQPEALKVFFNRLGRQDALIHKDVVDVGRCCMSHGLILSDHTHDCRHNARGHVEAESHALQHALRTRIWVHLVSTSTERLHPLMCMLTAGSALFSGDFGRRLALCLPPPARFPDNFVLCGLTCRNDSNIFMSMLFGQVCPLYCSSFGSP